MRRVVIGRAAAVVAVAAVAAGLVVAGLDDGNPDRRVRLLSGAAWLASSRVGQLTLLDGSSAEVAAQVWVAPQGRPIDVVQQGATAYAIDRSAGSIRRVDGATFAIGQPAVPIPDAGSGIAAFAGTTSVYALDTRRGLLAETDPTNLSTRGEPRSMAARVSEGGVAMDDGGRLWIIDPGTGDLTRVSAGGDRITRRLLGRPGAPRLTIAGGSPVVVDPVARTATGIDAETGHPRSAVELDLRPEDSVQVSGSPRAQRIYLVTSRGVLNVCDLGTRLCDQAIPLGAAADYGTAVEAGNRLFVPDFTGGRVLVVDLTGHTVVARPEVLPPGRFQLLSRDGVVFFNDPASERAGVVLLDGGVRKAAKYDAADPAKGLVSPGPTDAPTSAPPAPGPPPAPNPPPPAGEPPPSAPGPTAAPPPPPQSPPPSTVTPPPDAPQPPPELRIALSKTTADVNEDLTLEVRTTTGVTPASAHWDFNDGATGDAVTVRHRWATAGAYQVSVRVTMPGGQQATASVTIQVTAKGTLTTSHAGSGKLTGGGINCPPTCAANITVGQRVTLTATPDPGFEFSYWGAGCETTGGPSAALTCSFTMPADKFIAAGFTQSRVTFTAAVNGGRGGTVRVNGVACPPTCTTTHEPGANVTLAAEPAAGFRFILWTSGCPTTTAASCTVQATANRTITAVFDKPKVTLTVVLDGEGTVTGGGVNCAPTCSVQVDQGSEVTLTAVGAPGGWQMTRWSDVCVEPPFQIHCKMLMAADKSVTAVFRQS
jgi:hypothetical protein